MEFAGIAMGAQTAETVRTASADANAKRRQRGLGIMASSPRGNDADRGANPAIAAARGMNTIGKTRRHRPGPARGVLHRLAAGAFAHERVAAPADLGDVVEHFWRVRWNLAGLPAQTQETLPHPNVHLVIEPGEIAAYGVYSGRWTKRLEGRSQAFGIKFRPGAFRAFLDGPVAALADRSVAASALFGSAAPPLAAVLELDTAAACAHASAFLRAQLPAPDTAVRRTARAVADIVDTIVNDRRLHSAAALAADNAMSLRALQRLFHEYVGASPKWVIQRYRLHEALARVQAGEPVVWAALALDLGYFDQAHFIADFRKLVGTTPAEYSRAYLARAD